MGVEYHNEFGEELWQTNKSIIRICKSMKSDIDWFGETRFPDDQKEALENLFVGAQAATDALGSFVEFLQKAQEYHLGTTEKEKEDGE